MKIKIDIDNVIRDMGKEMVNLYNEQYGWRMTKPMSKEDITDYDVTISFPLLKENKINARKFFFKDNIDTVYLNAKPMSDAIEGINELKKQGHKIFLVSYQPTLESQEKTLEWLKEYNVPYDALIFTSKEDKTIVPADYIIDDCPMFLNADPAKKVCIDWAYNRGRNYDYRVKSITEFAQMIN